jgi:GNAT superfamily N-acetyltransferase
MLLGDPPPRPAEGIAREERDDERFREVELAVALDTREQAREIAEVLIGGRARLRASRDGTRTFLGAREGLDVCTVTLYSDGRIAQLEDVATLAAHRGHGIARAALSLATHEALDAGHEHVFLVVDSEEGPVPLYERLGYRLAAYFWTFTRPE